MAPMVEFEVIDDESDKASAAAPNDVERPRSEEAMMGDRAPLGIACPFEPEGGDCILVMLRPEAPPPAAAAVSLAFLRICPVIDSRRRPRLGTMDGEDAELSTSDLEEGRELDGEK